MNLSKKLSKILVASAFVVTQLNAAEAPPKLVKVDNVQEVNLSATTVLNGTLQSRAHIPITAGVSGAIEWLAEPGDYIKEGDVLVRMDLLPLTLKKSEQNAKLKRAKINLAYLKNELSRLQKLSKTNATSQFQLDQTRSEYELAQADIEIAEIKLKQIEDELSRATVKAPFDGVVTERFYRAGTDTNRSETLLNFLDTEQLEVILYVPIKYLGFVNKGELLTVKASGQVLDIPVSAKIPSADLRSQTFEVRLKLPEQENLVWAAGQLVQVTVPIQSAEKSLTVHRDALILRKEGTYVVKVGNDNIAERLFVTVGSGNEDRVSIVGDLKDGDRVAVRGAERLSSGQEVVVQ